MDKQIVRESKYRHLTGKVWKRELAYSNLKANNDAAILRANPTVMIFPLEGPGLSVSVVPLEMRGKQPDVWPQIDCHRTQVTDIDLYPFDDRIFATGSRDSEVKIWTMELCNWKSAPEDKRKLIDDQKQLLKSLKNPSVVLNGHSKKINTLTFHPSAAGVLASSSGDMTVKIWNVDKGQEILNLVGHKTQIRQTVWDQTGAFIASCEKTLKIFDPRSSNSLISETTPHVGAKGFKAQFISTEKMVTVGFGKGSERQGAIWDLRKLSSNQSEPISMVSIDQSPSLLNPVYDQDTGVLYLTGKGDSILAYEINNVAPYLHSLEKFNTGASYFDAVMLPKRMCDVGSCEVGRFLKLGRGTVDTISFNVPRKTADRLFQEDIFPPCLKGEPSLPSDSWFKGSNAPPVTMSLQPKGAVSVFDVSQEEGGKSRVVEEQKKKGEEQPNSTQKAASRRKNRQNKPPVITAGWVFLEKPGWVFSAWEEQWLTIVPRGLHFFESDEAANLKLSVSFDELSSVESQGDNFFVVKTQQPKTYRFQIEEKKERDLWVSTIEEKRKKFFLKKASDTPKTGKLDAKETVGASGVMAGTMNIQVPGILYSAWYSRWFVVKDGLLLYFLNHKEEDPIETFDLSRVLSVSITAGFSKEHPYTFKITTPSRIVHLSCSSEKDRNLWAATLEQYRTQCSSIRKAPIVSATQDPSQLIELDLSIPPVDCSKMEGYVKRRGVGIWAYTGRWTQYWLSTTGNKELFYYYYPTDHTPADRLSVSLITEISKGTTDVQFIIKISGGTETWYHEVESEQERDRWISVIQNLNSEPIDITQQLGLNIDEILDNPKTPKNLIDPVEVKKGRQPLLIEVKGKRKIRIGLTELTWKVLFHHGVFVLDAGRTIYQWNGKKAPRVSKAKALDLTTKLRMKERGGNATIVVLDDGTTDKENKEFWKLLGGGADEKREEGAIIESIFKEKVYRIFSPLDIQVNEENEQELDDDDRVDEQSIKLIFDGNGLPEKEILESNYAFIVDCFSELYVWIGKSSKSSTRALALSVAAEFESSKDRPSWTSVCKVYEEGETILFKEKFSNYPGMLPISTQKIEIKSNIAAAVTQEDPKELAKVMVQPISMIQEREIDDCSGNVKIWKIEEFDKVPIPNTGEFWSSESFLLHYAYKKGDKDCNLIYFWQGRFSSRSEKGTSAYLTVDLSDELDNAEQIRIEEGKETQHFLQLFSKKYTVHQGKFKEFSVEKERMYEFRGSESPRIVARQVDEISSKYLSSVNTICLVTPSKIYLWYGKISNLNQRTESKNIVINTLKVQSPSAELIEMEEGKENEEFLKKVGKEKPLTLENPVSVPRLFHVTGASGSVKIDEVYRFLQEDLQPEHVSILLSYKNIWVWFGPFSSHPERKLSLLAAMEVQSQLESSYSGCEIFVTSMYQEPLEFTRNFPIWCNYKKVPIAFKDKVHIKRQEPFEGILKEYLRETYSIQELMSDPLPPGVDPTKLDTYLTDEDFESVFNMRREEWTKVPSWKKDQLKEQVGLF